MPVVPVVSDLLGGASPTELDVLLNSACHFDFIWCLVAAVDGEEEGHYVFYTSFVALNQPRELSRPSTGLKATATCVRSSFLAPR